MWLSADEAKSDVILAAAATLFGGVIIGWLAAVPLYPDSGLLGDIVRIVEIAVIVGLVPYLLARYREGTLPQSFAVTGDHSMFWGGLLIASPIALLEIARRLLVTQSPSDALFGRVLFGQPTIASRMELAQVGTLLVQAVYLLVLAVATWMFLSFVIVRSRPAFRSPDMDVTEALRTFGLGAAGGGLVFGLVRSLVSRGGFVITLLSFVAVVTAILLTDRYVPARVETTRAAMLAPAIIVVVAHVLTGGGFFRGDLLSTLHRGFTAGALVIAMGALVESKHGWALPAIIAVVALWPMCLSPLPFAVLYC